MDNFPCNYKYRDATEAEFEAATEKLDFNQFATEYGIDDDREEFYLFARVQLKTPPGKIAPMFEDMWRDLYNQFLGQSDEQDLADTQADCLSVPF